jgi:uncharacterized protein YbbC (DUF1343 family)
LSQQLRKKFPQERSTRPLISIPILPLFFFLLGISTHHSLFARAKVLTGIDVLEAENFSRLRGLRVGIITNHTGRNREGKSNIDLMRRSSNFTLVRVFSPEHGLYGDLDKKVSSFLDSRTGLTVYSLYGDTRRPTKKMLEGIDILVFDVQDVGARFYTYITSMAYAMEEAGRFGIDFIVLDRPNPVNGVQVEGPVLDETRTSFIGYFPLPVRHGMTVGELAQLFKGENHLPVKLEVVKMEGWARRLWFDETDLTWVNPSPNIRSLAEATLYTTLGLLEATNVSVGRGTATPFEICGAPWIKADELQLFLRDRGIPGVQFKTADFTPESDRYKGQRCQGVRLVVTDRTQFQTVSCGLELAKALLHLYPKNFQTEELINRVGSEKLVEGLLRGLSIPELTGLCEDQLRIFRQIRRKYLLYLP